MRPDYTHKPVMLEEVVAALMPAPDACIVDATFGRGGHARALLAQLGPQGRLIAIDRDSQAIAAALELAAADPRVEVLHAPFAEMGGRLPELLGEQPVDAVLMDLGVSSPQLDDPERGFSFQHDGPLDMRMGTGARLSAADWLASASVDEMTRVFRELGEERYARRIARAIERERQEHPLLRTAQLAEVVSAAHPAWERDRHPATKVFMAIRLHVNGELEQVRLGLRAAVDLLRPGGRLAVISFHSLEDRIVKRFIRDESRGDPVLRKLPLQGETPGVRLRRLGGAQRPSAAETKANPRARSATLRVAERLEVTC